MRFFVISDLHMGEGLEVNQAKEQLKSLCSRIRADFPPNETIVFIVMGDIINTSNTNAFDDVRVCLSCIKTELHQFTVKFEFVPGNHDLPDGDIGPFNRFIAEFGDVYEYSKKHAYSRIYEDVNFIFADSNLHRDHRMPGKIDLEEIRNLVLPGENLLFCHHAFEHDSGSGHDIIENGSWLLKQLKAMGVGFVFHGHTHRSDITVSENGIVEIGTGALLKDLHDMDGVQNQFTSGCIRNRKLFHVERYVVSKDGGTTFPKATLYPESKTFVDPATVGKIEYEPVSNYIVRHVLPHTTAIAGVWERYFAREKKITLENAVRTHQKVLFLSDAGNGKSIELRNLVSSLKETTFFPFLYQLRDYSGAAIADLLPAEYSDILPYNLVLAFDGYDELTPADSLLFEKNLNAYVADNPGVHVVVSSRSNFCKAESDDKSKTFPEFYIFDLCELSREDSNAYLSLQGVDIDSFWSAASTSGIAGMLDNAFYLVKVCELFKCEGCLPAKAKLMDKLVELCFDTDDAKFVAHLEERYYSFMNLLSKVAFAMQLMQKNQFDDRTEYQVLFSDEERKLLKHSGLLVKDGASWRFLHNNFREFLAARYLSCMDQAAVTSYISNGDGIKPSWVNTLGYLTGMNLSWDLIGWISANAPNALVKFEPDRVDEALKHEIFCRLFTYYEDKRLWFNDDLCDTEELAYFSQSYDSLVFLLERITNPVHHISQYTALNIIRHYRGLYGMNKEVRECLISCCRNFPQTRKEICRLAIFALYQLGLYSPDVTAELVSLFKTNDTDYVRLGMYEYLVATNSHDIYVDYFLEGIKFIEQDRCLNSKKVGRVGNESFNLVEGLKAMSTEASVSAVLIWFAEKESEHLYSEDKIFSELAKRAIELYHKGGHNLYNVLLDCCVKALKKYNHENVRECICFFEETNMLKQATWDLLQAFKDDVRHLGDLLYTRPITTEYIIEAFQDGIFTDVDAFRDVAIFHIDDDEAYMKCSDLLQKRTGEGLPKRGEKIDYAAIRRKNKQESFDALFSKEKSEELLGYLIEELKQPDILVKDLLEVHLSMSTNSPASTLQMRIYHNAPKDSRVADFFKNRDFDIYTLLFCKKTLKQQTEIMVTEQQKNHIKTIVDRCISDGILKQGITYTSGNVTVSEVLIAVSYLSRCFDFALPEDALADMTLLPDLCFGESKKEIKYDYLKRHLGLEKLRSKIAKDMDIPNLDSMLLQDHIELCKREKWDLATSYAVAICLNQNSDEWLRRTSLEYLYALYGVSFIKGRILPSATGNFLNDIASICEDMPVDSLRPKFEAEYSANPTDGLQARLITYGSDVALRDYVNEVKKNRQIGDKDAYPSTPTQAVKAIRDPRFLPLLGELIPIVCDPEFVDEDFTGLYNSLSEALVNCGKMDQQVTVEMVENARLQLAGQERAERFCNYVIEEIKRNARRNSDQPMGLEQVKFLICT